MIQFVLKYFHIIKTRTVIHKKVGNIIYAFVLESITQSIQYILNIIILSRFPIFHQTQTFFLKN